MILLTIALRALNLWPVALCALGLLLAGTIVFYPPQILRHAAARRWLLPALRLGAMLALAGSILRPVLVRQRSPGEQGQVLMLLDRSLSMGVLDRSLEQPGDRQAIVGQLVSLADAMGRLPEGARVKDVTGLFDIQRLELLSDEISRTWREWEFARASGRQVRDAQARFDIAISEFKTVAAKAEASVKAAAPRSVLDHLAGLARGPSGNPRDWVRNLKSAVADAATDARKSQDVLDEELFNSDPRVSDACQELAAMSRLELCWELLARNPASLLSKLESEVPVAGFAVADRVIRLPLREGDQPVRRLNLTAGGSATDLVGSIADAIRNAGPQGVQSIVVFSDGRQIGSPRNLPPPGLIPPGVPVFTVYAASPSMRDLAIDSVELPPAVFVNEPISVRVSVRTLNIAPGSVRGVAGIGVGDAQPTTQPFRLSNRRTVQLPTVRLSEPGLQRLRINLSVQEGEADAENNQAERWVKVLAQRLRVALIAGSPNWDFRHVRNILSDTSWVQLRDAVVSRTSPLAMTRDEILRQDLIILNDVPREALGPQQWQAIQDLVRRRGGSLIVVAGPSFSQQQFAGPAMQELLPYPSGGPTAIWRTWLGQTPYYHLTPHASAAGVSLLHEEESEDAGWDDLPGFYRYLELPALKPAVRPLLVVRESGSPVLTEQRLGSGRVFFFGMNETWRWRARVGDRDQSRFWRQLLHHAADDPYALVQGAISFDAGPLSTEAGRPIQIRARILPGAASLPEQLDVMLMKDGVILKSITLEPFGDAGAGRYRATLAGLDAGDYDLQLLAPSDRGESAVLALPLKIQPNPQEELANIAGDREFLQRLSDATGGKCLNLEQVSSLPQLLAESRQRHPRTTELRLWDSGYLFIFVLSCLSAEWAMRKRFGLA